MLIWRKATQLISCVLLGLGITLLAHGQNVPLNPQVKYVLIISIDGLRPDAINESDAPNLRELIRQGAYCPTAKTTDPSVTLPAHMSMLTGLDPTKHKVRRNRYRGGYYKGATVFSVAKKAGFSTAMFIAKKSLLYLANPHILDMIYGFQPQKRSNVDITAVGLTAAFAEHWTKTKYALTFIHLQEPDKAGHRYGWMGKKYLKAVAQADRAIGEIIGILNRAGSWRATALIVTADHGGSGHHHKRLKPENVTIPWIAVGPGIPAGLLIERSISIYDTAPTALAFLDLKIPGDKNGRVVHEIFTTNRSH